MWGYASQSIEDYTYDAFNLVRGYRVRRARVPVDGQSTCSPDASLAPSDVWSYRFGPLQEREQKRQLSSSTDTTLAWVYTLVGADGKQLATFASDTVARRTNSSRVDTSVVSFRGISISNCVDKSAEPIMTSGLTPSALSARHRRCGLGL